jgi:AcrR family transcriptional regulator
VHSDEKILDAARELVLDGGARATTIDAIAAISGAPKGSLYHRFASVDDLLAQMWIRAVRRAQAGFLEALQSEDGVGAAVAAAVSLYEFAESHPADARLLAAMRREDLIDTSVVPERARELAALNRPLETAFAGLARRLFGRADRAAVEATICAISDLPIGALRRHLVAGTRFPAGLRRQIEAAVRAALFEAGAAA